MRENSPPNWYNCLPYAQIGVWSGVTLQKRIWSTFLLSRTILIRCFNFFSVCTYRPELIMTPLSKNSTNNIPWLSQKALAVTLPAEVCALNIFLRDDNDTIPLTVFSSVGRNDEPRFHHLYLFLTEKHLHHSHCAGVLHRYCFRANLCSTVSVFGTYLAQAFL